MRALIQRVGRAEVQINGGETRSVGRGFMILLGVARGDGHDDGDWLIRKISAMRVFEDETGKMNRSLIDIDGEALVVSQFTLLASTRKGNRPSFDTAAAPEEAAPLYKTFVDGLSRALAREVLTGEFGASMKISLVNEGPVTIVLDSRRRE